MHAHGRKVLCHSMLERGQLVRGETPLLREARLAPRLRRLAFHMRAEIALLRLGELAVARRRVRVQRSIARRQRALSVARLDRALLARSPDDLLVEVGVALALPVGPIWYGGSHCRDERLEDAVLFERFESCGGGRG